MTEANTVVLMERGRRRRRCLMCYVAYRTAFEHSRRKNPWQGEGRCRKGLHLLSSPDDVALHNGHLVCRQCIRDWAHEARARYAQVRCAQPYCSRRSRRSVDRTDPFYCRAHRLAGAA